MSSEIEPRLDVKAMEIIALNSSRIQDFVDYCVKHRTDLDVSFLSDEDLCTFKPDLENPTYISVNEQGQIIGAASLIIDAYNWQSRKARFRIFHSTTEDEKCLKGLLAALFGHVSGLNSVYLFIPLANRSLIGLVEKLKFTLERCSFLFLRDTPEVPRFSIPNGYIIRPFRLGIDEAAWCEVRNAAFACLKGSETPMTADMVAKMASGDEHIDDGMIMLFDGETPVGVVMGSIGKHKSSPVMDIGPLAIIPRYQGKGLGRALLRVVLQLAERAGYEKTVLCVNADNELAKALYINEGFKQVEALACYARDVN
jgi:mycothiol synthase